MHYYLHSLDCPVGNPSFRSAYSNADFDACTCVAFTRNTSERKLMQAYDRACEAPRSLTLQASLVEMQSRAESRGLTESEMEYWWKRLGELSHESSQASVTDSE